MTTVAVVPVDLDSSPIGTAGRLASDLCGTPVLTRTLERIVAAATVDHIVVTCPGIQRSAVQDLTAHRGIEVVAFDGPADPNRGTIRAARKWALDSWRGGLGNTCFFDEHTYPALCVSIATRLGAEVVVSVAAEAAVVDPALIDAMVEHQLRCGPQAKLVFAPAPPGLAPTVFRTDTLQEVAQNHLAVGWINSYRPDQPQRDMVNLATCFRPTRSVQLARARLTSDTRRGFELLERLIRSDGTAQSAEQICTWLAEQDHVDTVPTEAVIELTTTDPHDHSGLRPRGAILQRTGELPLDLLEQITRELAAYDDARMVLGGFGEPLCHPQFAEALAICRQAGIFALAVRTSGVGLQDAAVQALVDHQVDVVQINLDASDADGYAAVYGQHQWNAIMDGIDRLTTERRRRQQTAPVVAATLTKTQHNLSLMADFHDDWIRRHGCAIIEGFSHHAGLLEDRGFIATAGPMRRGCRQLQNRCTLLSDGRVIGCDQDFRGLYPVGTLPRQSLAECWQGPAMTALRRAHRAGQYDIHPMCGRCEEWHRP